MKKRLLCLPLLLLLLALLLPQAAWSKAAGTRDLVFEDEKEIGKNAEPEENLQPQPTIKNAVTISVNMALELKRGDKSDIVPPNSTFKSGDRVRILYSANTDGYVYWLGKMTSGKYTVLFPSQKTGMDNAIKKDEKYTMPVKGAFRFDDQTGTETLLCVLSPGKIPDLDAAVADANAGGRDVDLNSDKIAALEGMNLTKRQTRDLIFEEEEDENSNTKSQTAPEGEPFIAVFELEHE